MKQSTKKPLLCLLLAALIAFYSSSNLKENVLYAKRKNGDEYAIHDDSAVLKFFAENTVQYIKIQYYSRMMGGLQHEPVWRSVSCPDDFPK